MPRRRVERLVRLRWDGISKTGLWERFGALRGKSIRGPAKGDRGEPYSGYGRPVKWLCGGKAVGLGKTPNGQGEYDSGPTGGVRSVSTNRGENVLHEGRFWCVVAVIRRLNLNFSKKNGV